MASDVIASIWPLLAVLAFLLVTCVMSVLTHAHKHAIDTHNRIAECMRLRSDFIAKHDDLGSTNDRNG